MDYTEAFTCEGVLDTQGYKVKFLAKGSHFHQDMVMYFRDGSGQPEDDEYEVEEVELKEVLDTDGNSVLDKLSEETVESIKDVVSEAVCDGEFELEFEEEPEYDDYEEF